MENKKYKVLFLEDEPTIREVLKEYMTLSDYSVTEVSNGDEAIAFIKAQAFDMAVLDIMVPGASGFEVLKYIKENYPTMATIMLTALEDEGSQVHAFNLFADDYVIKPVSPIILLKRMETILRRTKQPYEPNRHKEGLFLDEEAFCAYYNDTPLQLTLSEFLLLETLYLQPNRVFNREQLILHIYNEDYIGNDRIIDAHVKNLRKKLPISCIKTVIGVGYQYQPEDKQ
jgi:DNA-binding response OmpR family regulator